MISIGMDRIVSSVAAFRDVPRAKLVGHCRWPEVVWARHEVCHIGRQLAKESYAQIGAELSGRDPTTIMHSAQRVATRFAAEPDYALEIEALMALIRRVGTATETGLIARAQRIVGAPGSVAESDIRSLALGLVAVNAVLADDTLSPADACNAALQLMTHFGAVQSAPAAIPTN